MYIIRDASYCVAGIFDDHVHWSEETIDADGVGKARIFPDLKTAKVWRDIVRSVYCWPDVEVSRIESGHVVETFYDD